MSVDWNESHHRRPGFAAHGDTSWPDERLSQQQRCVVSEVARRASIPTWAETLESTRAALCALGEWLDAPRRHAVARHLPADLAAALDSAGQTPVGGDDLVALYRCAGRHHAELSSLHEIALRCAAVLAVLGESLPPPVVSDLVDQLPPDIAALVPTSVPGAATRSPHRHPWLA